MGKSYSIKGDIPAVGEEAPDFTFVVKDFSERSLIDDFEGVRVLIAVPSVDTSVCRKEARRFNEELGKRKGVTGIVISKDLPYAMNRFCEGDGITNVITGSDYRYNDFIQEYNTEILSGPMKGLSARAVFVVGPNQRIEYAELVPDIGQEPDYEQIMQVVDELLEA